MPETLDDWQVWMRGAGLSVRTIQQRLDVIRMLEAREHVDPREASWEPLAEFLAGFTPATQQTYRAVLRSWYHWLVLMDYRIDDPTLKLHKGKTVRRSPRPVTPGQLASIFATRMHARTRVMILLGAYEGLRVHEIAKIRGEDIDGDILRVLGKGNVYEELPLHPLVADAARTMPAIGFWFPSYVNDGQPLLAGSVSHIIGEVMRRAEVRRTAHALRHFFGTEALKASGNLAVVQKLMRHVNIASTVGYTQVDLEERRAVVLALPVPPFVRRVA